MLGPLRSIASRGTVAAAAPDDRAWVAQNTSWSTGEIVAKARAISVGPRST